ncbi:NYN domain-containing protein [Frigidibacter sp. MR17.24]|uniref:NYN domain-containing protein n=1 Tax=Frigidibacter sp. MR17.24 TaxID=3127345 RepID=UPI003012AD98
MFALFVILMASCAALIASLLSPQLTDLLLIAAPCALASLFLILKTAWRARLSRSAKRSWIILDGSNIMHWKGTGPDTAVVKDAIRLLVARGFTPGVVFDANVGYKLFDRYQDDGALAKLLGLPQDRVLVVPKGTPADEIILSAARDHGARVVTNDRYRDWAERHPEVSEEGFLVRGGYRDGAVWLALPDNPAR